MFVRNSFSGTQKLNKAFTLIELLLVIGIIALLIGLLLPAVSKVRISAQRVSTQATLTRLSSAIDLYFQATGSYPGVNNNDRLANTPGTSALNNPVTVPPETIHYLNYPGSPAASNVLTSTENMMISVLGGLRRTTTGTAEYDFDLAAVGQGAASLNINKPGRLQPFLEVKSNELTTGFETPTGLAGQWTANDSAVPELLDGFASPRPILYMRANRGESGFIATSADGTATAASLAPNVPQYDVRQLYAYGFPQDNDMAFQAAYPEYKPNAQIILRAGSESYFGNHELSSEPTTTTISRVVRGKDAYVLISAGPDGKFGTADDIRN